MNIIKNSKKYKNDYDEELLHILHLKYLEELNDLNERRHMENIYCGFIRIPLLRYSLFNNEVKSIIKKRELLVNILPRDVCNEIVKYLFVPMRLDITHNFKYELFNDNYNPYDEL